MILFETEGGEIQVWLTNTSNPIDGYLCGFGVTKKEALERAMSCLNDDIGDVQRHLKNINQEEQSHA